MLSYDSSVHHTVTHRIHTSSWEFVCPTCGYRARYISSASGSQELEIVNIGDPHARHVSGDWPVVQRAETRSVRVTVAEDEDDESWLTPELRQQMEELLRDVDMGDEGI